MTPLAGFAPDLDPTTPGVITACTQVVPTLKGIAGAPTAIDAGLDALPTVCNGAAFLTLLSGSRRLLAGTQTKLYELGGASWVDVSRVGGYTGSSENVWRFAQFGNVSLAANQTGKIQYSAGGAFSDIAQAPKARIIVTASGFVMALCIDDVTVGGDRSDAWWCSGLYDYATWTPGASTQAQFGYLLDTPGEIRAGKALGADIIVYKEKSIYLGRYVGPPVVWAWQVIASDVGALSNECVVDTGTAHLFISSDDFYIFDGSTPRSIGAPIREWFFTVSDSTYRYKIKSYYDRARDLVWWFYAPTTSAGALTDALVYHLKTGKWGHAAVTIECALQYFSGDTSWDNWPPGPSTDFESIVDVPFDSPYFDNNQSAQAIFGTNNKIATLTGACSSASITTGDIGDESLVSDLTSVRPRYLVKPSSATMTNYTKMETDGALTLGSTAQRNGNKFDVLASARYHRLRFDMTGDFEMVGFEPELVQDGEA